MGAEEQISLMQLSNGDRPIAQWVNRCMGLEGPMRSRVGLGLQGPRGSRGRPSGSKGVGVMVSSNDEDRLL